MSLSDPQLLELPRCDYSLDQTQILDPTSLNRSLTVAPSMCGNNNLLAARLGDWTWEAVSHACQINAFRAVDNAGAPTYLSFYYIEMNGSAQSPLNGLAFGDRLDVTSTCFRLGSESVVTYHRLSPTAAAALQPVSPAEHHDMLPGSAAIRAMTVNRWISRHDQGNEALKSASPAGFDLALLPDVPPDLSPRRSYDQARRLGTFADDRYGPPLASFRFPWRVDPAQDLNGVGLLYFASFFAIVNRSIWSAWQALGRTTEGYLARVELSQRILYLGNADAGAGLTAHVCLRRSANGAAEHADVRLVQDGSERVLAVAEFVTEIRE